MPEADDAEIWEFAKAQDFCILTQDADFADRSRLYGSPPKVVWLRCGNTATSVVETLLRGSISSIHELMKSSVLDCLELYWNAEEWAIVTQYFMIDSNYFEGLTMTPKLKAAIQ